MLEEVEAKTTQWCFEVVGRKRKLIEKMDEEIRYKKAKLEELNEELHWERKRLIVSSRKVEVLLRLEQILDSPEENTLGDRVEAISNDLGNLEGKVDDVQDSWEEFAGDLEVQVDYLHSQIENLRGMVESVV